MLAPLAMDVTCERCGTEYEFDETLVSDRGTTVKCTNCGHLFKVFRGSSASAVAAPAESAADTKKAWTLHTEAGGSRPIQSLKELQRLIAEGAVGEDDELSRSGEPGKRLGDIAELSTFFSAARAAATTPRRDPTGRSEVRADTARGMQRPDADATKVAPRQGKGTMMGMGGRAAGAPPRPAALAGDEVRRTQQAAVAPPSSPPPALPPRRPASERPAPPEVETRRDPTPAPRRDPTPAPRRDPTPRAEAATAPLRDLPASPREVPAPPPAPPPRRDPTPAAPRPPVAPPARPIAPTREAQLSSPPRPRSLESRAAEPVARRPVSEQPPRLKIDEDEDRPRAAPRRSSSGMWVALVVLLAAGAGVALGWDRIQALLAPAEDGGAAFIAAGDEAVARDRDEGYRDAIGEYTKALGLNDHDVRALVGLSRAHALLAQNRLFEAADLEARAADDAALAGEAAAARRDATEHTTPARENAELAVRLGSGGAAAEVVLADALRLSDDPLARSRLDRARTLEPTPSAEALRVDALLAAAGGSLAASVPLAEQAVAEDPGLLRARILLARAHLAAGDVAAARQQLSAVLTRDAEHPIATALLAAVEGAPAVVPDAGVAIVIPAPPPIVAGDSTTTGGTTTSTGSSGSSSSGSSSSGSSSSGSGEGSGGRTYEALIATARETLNNGNAARARTLYEQALSSRPGGPEALTGLGFCLLANGDANGALSRFRTASATGYSEALIGMGDAYRRIGDIDRALEAYEQYLTRSPAGPHASIARRQIERLRASGATSSGTTPSGGSDGALGTSGSGGSEGSSGTPETAPDELPAPSGTTEPPPSDTPAIDSAP